jgi:hypothetical membrane protein
LSRKHYALYFIWVLSIAFGLLLISANLYSSPFSWRTVAISNLGNPNLNPRGWWIFTLDFVFAGIALLPIFKYLSSIFQTRSFNTPRIGSFWQMLMLFSSIGLIGVGIFNETLGPIHYIFAIFGFGGMGLNIVYTFALLGYDIFHQRKWFRVTPWVILYFFTFLGISVILREFAIYGISNPADLNFSEWWGLVILIGWFIGAYFLFENEI